MVHESGGAHRKRAFRCPRQQGGEHLETTDRGERWGGVGVDKLIDAHITHIMSRGFIFRAGVAEPHDQPLGLGEFGGGGGTEE